MPPLPRQDLVDVTTMPGASPPSSPSGVVITTSSSRPSSSSRQNGGGGRAAQKNKIAVNADDFEVGGQVLTLYGRGRILQVRSKQVKIQCLNWKLANNSKVVMCINNSDVLATLSKTKATHMASVDDKCRYFAALKKAAQAELLSGRLGSALDLYRKTITVVTALLQHDTERNASQRADWLVTVVKCSNSAAMLCLELDLYGECMALTRNAMLVLDALEGDSGGKSRKKKDDDAVVGVSNGSFDADDDHVSTDTPVSLQQVGQVKLFGECRVQALLYMATALLELDQPAACKTACQQAQACLVKYSAPEYMDHPEYRSILKRLVKLQKKLKEIKKQAREARKAAKQGGSGKIVSAMRLSSANKSSSPARSKKISWFDDIVVSRTGSRRSKEPVVFDDFSEFEDDDEWEISWYQRRPANVLAFTAVVAVGTVAVARLVFAKQRRF